MDRYDLLAIVFEEHDIKGRTKRGVVELVGNYDTPREIEDDVDLENMLVTTHA